MKGRFSKEALVPASVRDCSAYEEGVDVRGSHCIKCDCLG